MFLSAIEILHWWIRQALRWLKGDVIFSNDFQICFPCRASDWKLDQPDWTGRLRITSKGKVAYIKLEDRVSGEAVWRRCLRIRLLMLWPDQEFPCGAFKHVFFYLKVFLFCIFLPKRNAEGIWTPLNSCSNICANGFAWLHWICMERRVMLFCLHCMGWHPIWWWFILMHS